MSFYKDEAQLVATRQLQRHLLRAEPLRVDCA
jgi:hypothetical protein